MAEKNCPSVAWLCRNNDNRSSGFFTRTCLHTSITIFAHSDNHRRHSTPLQPLAPCSQREDILAAAPIRGPFEMDLLCIMWIGHPFLSIRADGNITIKHRANLMLAFIALLSTLNKNTSQIFNFAQLNKTCFHNSGQSSVKKNQKKTG